jgi:hypothetical protein
MVSSAPIGSWMATALGFSLSLIELRLMAKSAPILSILLTKQSLGTLYLSACLQTVSD